MKVEDQVQVYCMQAGQVPGRPVRLLEGHEGRVSCLAASVEDLLVSGAWDCSLRLWRPSTGACLAVVRLGPAPPTRIWLLGDTRLAWTDQEGGVVVRARAGAGQQLLKLEAGAGVGVECGEEELAIWQPGSPALSLYSSRTGVRLRNGVLEARAPVVCAALQARLLVLGTGAGLELWDCTGPALLARLECGPVAQLSLAPHLLVCLLPPATVRYWPLLATLDRGLPGLAGLGGELQGAEPVWRGIAAASSCLVLGLERRLGELAVWRWDEEQKPDPRPAPRPATGRLSYRYDCRPDCVQCRPAGLRTPLLPEIDLK